MTIEVSTLLASAIFTYIAFKLLFFVGICLLYYFIIKSFMADTKTKEELKRYQDSDPHLTDGQPDFTSST